MREIDPRDCQSEWPDTDDARKILKELGPPPVTTPNIPELSREFAKLAGIEWHEPVNDLSSNDDEYVCFCGAKCMGSGEYVMHLPQFYHTPDFSDAREVIRVMRERENWDQFCYDVGRVYDFGTQKEHLVSVRFVMIPGLMLERAVRFLRKENS